MSRRTAQRSRDARAGTAGAARCGAEDGFTLPEMLVVLAILGIVLAGLTQLFTSAIRSQIDQTRRVNAQQDARVALDQLRREIHCGSALTYNSASSVTVTLPSYCSGAEDDAERHRHAAERGDRESPAPSGSTRDEHDLVRLVRHRDVHRRRPRRRSPDAAAARRDVSLGRGRDEPGHVVRDHERAAVHAQAVRGERVRRRRRMHGRRRQSRATSWLVSSSVFSSYTRPTTLVGAPTFSVATTGGTIQPGHLLRTTSPR